MAAPGRRVLALRRLHRLVFACGAGLVAIAAAPAPALAQAPGETPRFEVRRFAVEGNSVLAPAAIDDVLAPHTGPARSFADVQAAADALQRAYARAGFGAVQVSLPEQQLHDGVVRIVVLELPLRSVTIEGNSHFDDAAIRRTLPALRNATTPNTDDLAAQIRLANENPARRLSVDLKRDESGGIDATVAVRDEKPWKVGAVLDNTGTPATGRLRSGVFFQHANVADLDHVLTAQYVTSPEHVEEVTIAALNYRVPIQAFGDAVDLYAVHADVDSGVVGDLFTVRGRGSVVGVRYQHNLPPTAALRQRLSAGFEERRFDNQVGTVGGSPDLLADVTVHPASIGYSATWSGVRSAVELGTTLVRNIPGHAHGRAEDFEAARAGARAGYSLLRWSAALARDLPSGWQLRIVGDGQATRDALVAGEQFGIGGQDSVRGFLEREITNDKGWRASIELRSPDFGARLGNGVSAQALVFHDRGRVSRNDALPGEATGASIASVGVGLRLAMAPSTTARVDLAHVLRGAGVRARGEDSVHFSVGVAY
jgi:hemolysin activation/secretion protein